MHYKPRFEVPVIVILHTISALFAMANLDPSQGFQDFDNRSVYETCEAAIQKADTLNMVIEFDSANARVALDVKNVEKKV